MPSPIPREVRAFAFGLIMGVGGSSYSPSEISRLVRERFGESIASKTISNWKSDLPGHMEKYGIGEDYIKEVIDRSLFGAQKSRGSPEDDDREMAGTPPQEGDDDRETPPGARGLPNFNSLADVVAYMEGQGFIVATSNQDLRNILDQYGLTVLDKGALKTGPEIISIEPLELDFEVVGKKIAGNPVIMWYYGLTRKLAMLKGEEVPELDVYVTGCVVDAMVARKWNMAVLRA